MSKFSNIRKVRVHDGILGGLIVFGLAMAHFVSYQFIVLPFAIGILMLFNTVTGFCPVCYTLDCLGFKTDDPSEKK